MAYSGRVAERGGSFLGERRAGFAKSKWKSAAFLLPGGVTSPLGPSTALGQTAVREPNPSPRFAQDDGIVNERLSRGAPSGLGILACSKQEIPLGHRQHFGRFAAQHAAVGLDGVGLGIDLDLRQRVVPEQVAFGDLPRVLHGRRGAFADRARASAPDRSAASLTKVTRGRIFRAAVRGELRAVERRLRRRDARVRVAHVGQAMRPPFRIDLRFHAEEGRLPDDEVGEFAGLDAADFVRDAVRNGRVDRVFGDVAQGAEIIGGGVDRARRACRTASSSCARSARCG